MLLSKSQIFWQGTLPYLTKGCLKCYWECVQSFWNSLKVQISSFIDIHVSNWANLSLVLLIKALLINEEACVMVNTFAYYGVLRWRGVTRCIYYPHLKKDSHLFSRILRMCDQMFFVLFGIFPYRQERICLNIYPTGV